MTMLERPINLYSPFAWHWIVGGDENRYWSSAAGTYVETLPEGAGFTRIPTEDELNEVLRRYGLPGPAYTAEDAMRDLVALLGAEAASILAGYPEGEPQSWPAKEAEAREAVAAGGAGLYPLLAGEIAATLGISAGEVTTQQIAVKAAGVLAKATAWRELVSRVAGLRQRFSAGLAAATTADERRAVIAAARAELGS